MTLVFLVAGMSRAQGQQLYVDPQFEVQESTEVYAQGELLLGDVDLSLDIFEPIDGPPLRPGFVLIHGGAFVAGDRSDPRIAQIATEFASRGYVCVSISYRLATSFPVVGADYEALEEAGGDLIGTPVAAATEDAVKALRWMRDNADRFQIDPTRLAIGGGSAGAITALVVAYLLDDFPVPDVPPVRAVMDLWGGLFFQILGLEADEPPVIIIHGTEDEIVPFLEATALVARADEVGVITEFFPIEGAGHSFTEIPIFTVEVEGVTLLQQVVNFFFIHLDLGPPPNAARDRLWSLYP